MSARTTVITHRVARSVTLPLPKPLPVCELPALLFALLALAMFGVYELQLPSGLRNRLNSISQNQKGGQVLSVFVIGVLSALVVSPCVSAPLAGALVYISTTGDAFTGFAALLALGLGMGTPLIILGTTGASVLPKAGGWMNQIKVFFGILLLAVAVWLLSRILPGSISLLLWALLAIIYAVVLGAFEAAASTAQRVVKGIAWVLLLYGVMALAGALMGNSNPLKPLQLTGSFSSAATAASESSLFYRTESVTDIEQKIASAKGPVMLDLYADWCISCKVMEDEIFAQSDVQQRLSHVMWLHSLRLYLMTKDLPLRRTGRREGCPLMSYRLRVLDLKLTAGNTF